MEGGPFRKCASCPSIAHVRSRVPFSKWGYRLRLPPNVGKNKFNIVQQLHGWRAIIIIIQNGAFAAAPILLLLPHAPPAPPAPHPLPERHETAVSELSPARETLLVGDESDLERPGVHFVKSGTSSPDQETATNPAQDHPAATAETLEDLQRRRRQRQPAMCPSSWAATWASVPSSSPYLGQ